MKLSILIPCYNSAKYLETLVPALCSQVDIELRKSVEIIVADNASNDRTPSVISELEKKYAFKYVRYNEHVLTAEENIFRGVRGALGEWTWVLGSDDNPSHTAVADILANLDPTSDHLLFNYSLVDTANQEVNSSLVRFSERNIQLPFVELAEQLGIWFILAGISCQIVKTSLMKSVDLQKQITETTNPIYSHIFGLLREAGQSKATFVNQKLIEYRVGGSPIEHWQRTAKKLGTFTEFFWTLGTVRQLKWLEQNEITDRHFLRYWVERSPYTTFRPVVILMGKLFTQISHDYVEIRFQKPINDIKISVPEILEICSFVEERLPELGLLIQDTRACARDIETTGKFTRSGVQNLRDSLEDFDSSGFGRVWAVTEIDETVVYKYRQTYFALSPSSNMTVGDAVFVVLNSKAEHEFVRGFDLSDVIERAKVERTKYTALLQVRHDHAELLEARTKLKELKNSKSYRVAIRLKRLMYFFGFARVATKILKRLEWSV